MMKGTKGWLLFIAVATVVLVLVLGSQCQAALEDAIAATCRMLTPVSGGNDVGSGFCIANDPEVWVVTNAHVVKDGTTHYSEWYSDGNKSTKVPLTLVWKWYDPKTVKHRRRIDFAILKVDRAWFGDRVPFAVQFPPADYVAPKGSMVWTVGCPGGAAPTALRSMVAGYEQEGASIKLLPKVEDGRSGSGVFDETGTYLLGLVDSCDPDSGPYKGPYGYALDHSRVRALLSPMSARQETRLFDRLRSGSGGLCQNGICGNRGQQQQATPPPGTGQAYPQLPPLKGIDDVPPLPPAPMVDEVARDEIDLVKQELRALEQALSLKDQQAKALFGEDYALLKEIAANATAAKTAAEVATATAADASQGVGVLTGTLLALPETIDTAVGEAVAAKVPADINQWGVIRDGYRKIKERVNGLEGEDGEGGKLSKLKALLALATNPMALVTKLGWPLGILGVLIVVVWMRVEYKIKAGKSLVTVEAAKAAAEAVKHIAGHAVEAVGEVRERAHDRLAGAFGRVADRIQERKARRREAAEEAEVLAEMAEMAKEVAA